MGIFEVIAGVFLGYIADKINLYALLTGATLSA